MINTTYNLPAPAFTGHVKVSISKLEQHLNNGLSIKEIAKILDISERTVYYLIARFNLKLPSKIHSEKIDFVLPKYTGQNISIREINKKTGLSRVAIQKWYQQNFTNSPKRIWLQKIMPLLKSDMSSKEIAQITNTDINIIKYLRQQYKLGNRKLKKENMMAKIIKKFKEGLNKSEIATDLGISRDTVGRYLKNFFSKN